MKFKNINLIQSVSVLGQKSPGPLDVLCQVHQVGGSRVGGDDPLQSAPLVLNGVQVTGLPHPDKNRNARLLQPGKDGACRVAGSTILHKDCASSPGHGPPQMFLEHILVHTCIHFRVWLNKVEFSKLSICKRGPNHQFWRMLDCPHDASGMVPGDGRWPPDSLAHLGRAVFLSAGLAKPLSPAPSQLLASLVPLSLSSICSGSWRGSGGSWVTMPDFNIFSAETLVELLLWGFFLDGAALALAAWAAFPAVQAIEIICV